VSSIKGFSSIFVTVDICNSGDTILSNQKRGEKTILTPDTHSRNKEEHDGTVMNTNPAFDLHGSSRYLSKVDPHEEFSNE